MGLSQTGAGVSAPPKALKIGNRWLDLTLNASSAAFRIADRRAGRQWVQAPYTNESADLKVVDARREEPSVDMVPYRVFTNEITVKKARVENRARMVIDLHEKMNDVDFTAIVEAAEDKPEIHVTLKGSGRMPWPLAFPRPFVTEKGTALVVPHGEGVLYPVDDETIQPLQFCANAGHRGLSMAWYGAFDPETGAGVMTILETPDDAGMEVTRRQKVSGPALSVLFARPLWDATQGEFGYDRKLTYAVFDKGGYVAQAKRYHEYAQSRGLVKTLEQKRRENPNVDRLIGAVNFWAMSWSADRNWDRVAQAREMKSLGMEHLLWSAGGPPDQLREINSLGFLTSRYDEYQDIYPTSGTPPRPTEGWPQDLVLLPSGDWMKGWAQIQKRPDGTESVFQGGVRTSGRGLEMAKKLIPEDLKTSPYNCRFIDVVTARPWREDYNPLHRLTRSDDKRNKMAMLDFISRDLGLVLGAEAGIDTAVPYAHYFEGMLSMAAYRLPDAGRDMLLYKKPTPEFLKFQVGHYNRVPLWELVYHDCMVSYWYWGDYNNKVPEVWDRRDLFNILYATPPMYVMNKAMWEKDKERFAESCRNIHPAARKLGYDQMVSHEFLTADHSVQRTRWSSGAAVIVNFGDSPYAILEGGTVKPMGWVLLDSRH